MPIFLESLQSYTIPINNEHLVYKRLHWFDKRYSVKAQ